MYSGIDKLHIEDRRMIHCKLQSKVYLPKQLRKRLRSSNNASSHCRPLMQGLLDVSRVTIRAFLHS